MKRKLLAIALAAMLLLSCFALMGCGPVTDAKYEYYGTGQWADWSTKDEFKMEAISASDKRISSIKSQISKPGAIYILEVTITAGAEWNFSYKIDGVTKTFNGNQAVKLQCYEIDREEGAGPLWWGPSPESGEIKNLTPDTLYLPTYRKEDTAGDGTGTWNDNPAALALGTYYLVYVRNGDGTKLMGLVPKV